MIEVEKKLDFINKHFLGDTEKSFVNFTNELKKLYGKNRTALFVLDKLNCEFTSKNADDIDIDGFSYADFSEAKNLLKEFHSLDKCIEIHRNSMVISYFFFDSEFVKENEELYRYLDFVPFIYNRSIQEKLVNNLNAAASFDVNSDTFFSSLSEIAKKSSAAPFGAYRAKRGANLNCLFKWGFPKGLSNSDLDLEIKSVSTIEKALTTGKVQVCDNLLEEHPNFASLQPFQRNVESFCATPVKVGESIEGVLTLGFPVFYESTENEIAGYLCIANGLGVSISNYKLLWEGRSRGAEFERMVSSTVGVEVAQSIRHAMFEMAGNVATSLRFSASILAEKNSTPKKLSDALGWVKDAQKDNSELQKQVSAMRDVMTVNKVVRVSSVSRLWSETLQHLDHRLDELNINAHPLTKMDSIPLLSDVVKHVFHNLLINSIDAFSNTSAAKPRNIWLRMKHFDKIGKKVFLTYYDDGPGLSISALNAASASTNALAEFDQPSSEDIGELIFENGITTKKNGTGFGLYLCRRMTLYHGGGILHRSPESKQGAMFDIELSYNVFDLSEKNGGALRIENKKGELVHFEPNHFINNPNEYEKNKRR